MASLGLVAILAISTAVGGGGTVVPAFVAAIVFTFLPSYATSGGSGQFGFQLGFGVAAIAAALLSNGRGSRLFSGLAVRSGDRVADSPVRDRVVEARVRALT